MRTFRYTLQPYRRPWWRCPRSPIGRAPTPATPARAPIDARGQRDFQAGFMLLEVVISALLVALIAIGTFAGIEGASRAGADQRAHAEASKLVQQDEERLRGLTATALVELSKKSTETTITEGGTAFTITSSASFVSAEKNALSCESKGAADYIQTTSSAKWKALGTRPAVSQSSLISTLVTGLLVKVKNQTEAPVEGVTVNVTGATAQTTPASGCVLFIGLPPGAVTVSITKAGYVDTNGKEPPPSKPATINKEHIETTEFQIAPPGAIEAKFEAYNEKKEKVAVTSDEFIAEQSHIAEPERFLGGKPETYVASAAIEKKLFPFTKPEKPTYPPEPYSVFAGICPSNNPKTVTKGGENLEPAEGKVIANETAKVVVEAPAINLTVYESTEAEVTSKKNVKVLTTASAASEIVNPECVATAKAQNYAGTIPNKHKVTLNAEGHLTQKNWPYAKTLEICVIAKDGVKFAKFLKSVENKSKLGIVVPAYMKNVEKKPEYETKTKESELTKCP